LAKIEVHKFALKKEQGQYPAILSKQAWSIIMWLWGKFFLQHAAGSPEQAR